LAPRPRPALTRRSGVAWIKILAPVMLGRSLAIPDSLLGAAIMRPCQWPSARCERAVGARALLLRVLADVLHQADLGPRIRRQGPAPGNRVCGMHPAAYRRLSTQSSKARTRWQTDRSSTAPEESRVVSDGHPVSGHGVSEDDVSRHEDDVLRHAGLPAVETELRAAVHLESCTSGERRLNAGMPPWRRRGTRLARGAVRALVWSRRYLLDPEATARALVGALLRDRRVRPLADREPAGRRPHEECSCCGSPGDHGRRRLGAPGIWRVHQREMF
jgi:hypothetical protein